MLTNDKKNELATPAETPVSQLPRRVLPGGEMLEVEAIPSSINYNGLDVNSLYAIAKQKLDVELSNSLYFHARLRSGDITTVPFGVGGPTGVINEIQSIFTAMLEAVLGVAH